MWRFVFGSWPNGGSGHVPVTAGRQPGLPVGDAFESQRPSCEIVQQIFLDRTRYFARCHQFADERVAIAANPFSSFARFKTLPVMIAFSSSSFCAPARWVLSFSKCNAP